MFEPAKVVKVVALRFCAAPVPVRETGALGLFDQRLSGVGGCPCIGRESEGYY